MSLRQVQWLFGSWGDKFVFVGVIRLEDIQILGGRSDAERRDIPSLCRPALPQPVDRL